MRLATFVHGGRRTVGIVVNEEVVDLSGTLAGSAEGTSGDQMIALLTLGAEGLQRAQAALASGRRIALTQVRLLAPVLRPGKFLALASNYKSHVNDILRSDALPGYKPPEYPKWFNKQITCIAGPHDPVELPRVTEKLDYEAELAFVIGRRCRHVTAAQAPQVIAGYTICNDFSVRDWQRHSNTITIGKSFDTHGPLGPWLVTPDEIGDPHDLRLRCYVNGELRQDANTGEMVHSCFDQIAYLSQVCTLEPGDVIATGTPAGVGALMDPPHFLAVGDVVRCEIEKIGAIENRIVAEAAASVRVDTAAQAQA